MFKECVRPVDDTLIYRMNGWSQLLTDHGPKNAQISNENDPRDIR